MAKKSRRRVGDSLGDFLFVKIAEDPNFISWEEVNELPAYIKDNLSGSKQLRDYQTTAIKQFIYLFESGRQNEAKHLMFNMATGTGKTLVMAACMLYLYERGYRRFVFLVHQVQILKQARKNFIDYKFEKYLFNQDGVRFNGRRIDVREVTQFQDATQNDINILFTTTSMLYNRIKEDAENSLTREDFASDDIVVIADEAHRLNVETRRNRTRSDNEEMMNWESAVREVVGSREGNMLLEFTATVDLANASIHSKYKDKIIYKYDFISFNKDGYSKDVKFLYNNETQIEDQRKLLIVNAVALSQIRKILFQQFAGTDVNPVVLIKSKRIADSEADREYFNGVIENLHVKDLEKLRDTKQDEFGLISGIFSWLKNQGISLEEFVSGIKQDFAPNNTITYNSQKKERAEVLADLDSYLSTIRAVFSVNALNEGWDVLSLFDIIHFDISENKDVSLQDVQLIGRGARYYPFGLPENITDGLFGSYETDLFRRKFDQAPTEEARLLETLFYHFVRTGTFLEKLQEELMGEGIINEGVERRTIRMKQSFLDSNTYNRGFVLVNRNVKRERTSEDEIENTFKREIKAASYQLRARGLTDREQNELQAQQGIRLINISINFNEVIIQKALIQAENGFFRFSNLVKHIPELDSVDTFISKYLSLYKIKYSYEKGKDIFDLSAGEKLQLLINAILPEVRRAIDIHMPHTVGSEEFRPVSISVVFEREKSIYLSAFPSIDPETGEVVYEAPVERGLPQTDNPNPDLHLSISDLDWYAYDENFGTSEEKKFVKFIDRNVEALRGKYPGAEIYLIRNELDYWLFSEDGRRFSPDYLLFINDEKNKKYYYQCIFEAKGGHLLEKDEWKEKSLLSISGNSKVSFSLGDDPNKVYGEYLKSIESKGYVEIKNVGFSFYNTDPREESDFELDFDNKLLR